MGLMRGRPSFWSKRGVVVALLLFVTAILVFTMNQGQEHRGFENPIRMRGEKTSTPEKRDKHEDKRDRQETKKSGSKGNNNSPEFLAEEVVSNGVRSAHEDEESTGEYTHLTYEHCGPYTARRNHGVVVLLVLESSPFNMLNTLAKAMPSWDKFFLPAQGLDLLLVFPADAAKDIEEVAEKLLHLEEHPENEKVAKKLGSMKVWQYRTSTEYRVYTHRIPKVPIPHYAKALLAEKGGQVACGGGGRTFSESYVTGNMWYIRQMFDLKLLSCYKYFFKVDYDVFFLRPLSVDIFRQMEVKGAVFLHSGTAVQKSCGADMDTAMLDFTKDNKLQFKTKTVSFLEHAKSTTYDYDISFPFAGDVYAGNLVGGRIDFWNSKKVLKLAEFLENYPSGFYKNRWTDQTYWHNVLALFLPKYDQQVLSIDADRTLAISDEEELKGSFFHSKNLDAQAINLYCETVFGCSPEAADEMRFQMNTAEEVQVVTKHVRQCMKWGCTHAATYFSRVLVMALQEKPPIAADVHRAALASVTRWSWPLLTELKLWRQKAWKMIRTGGTKNSTYFLHFSKAGGTSVCKLFQNSPVLKGQVSKTNCYENRGGAWRDGVHDGSYWGRSRYKYKQSFFVERTCAERNRVHKKRFFAVERYFDPEICDNFIYMTMMRTPEQRLKSHLSHMQSVYHTQAAEGVKSFAHPQFTSLESALEHAPEQSNYYVRMLLGKKGFFADTLGMDHMRRARQVLLEKFDVIMTLEEIGCSNVMLQHMSELQKDAELPMENVRFEEQEGHNRTKTIGFLAASGEAKLEEHLSLDNMLYQAALKMQLADCMIFNAH
mmetsp:Transcript_16891/g.28523  ORF Transcript_16891/g.28523 Transcript_16891/m.28523 type:complete len:825 (-) Transcript_16891:110-2584(-)